MIDRSATLLALAARAEDGGDAGLSDDVWRAMGWIKSGDNWSPTPAGGYDASEWFPDPRPDLTHSIDAQAELPGRITEMYIEDGMVTAGAVLDKILCYGEATGENAEKRARLAALLRAAAASEAPRHE